MLSDPVRHNFKHVMLIDVKHVVVWSANIVIVEEEFTWMGEKEEG